MMNGSDYYLDYTFGYFVVPVEMELVSWDYA
jgi:hypothetical protein